MEALGRKRPIFHSEADFQHALAWEVQTAHATASIRLEKRVATDPNIELDLLIELDGQMLGVELKYPRKGMTAEVNGELFALSDGAADQGRYLAIKDCARLERLVAEGIIDSGALILLTNWAKVWAPPASEGPVLYDAVRMHDGHTLRGTVAWGEGGKAGGRPRGGPVTLTGTYPLVWRDYSTVEGKQFRYLLVGVDAAGPG